MEEFSLNEQRTYRYPTFYRLFAVFGALLFGLIVLGSIVALLNAIRNDGLKVVLYLLAMVSGSAVIIWGLEFATRSITLTPDGLHVRWLLRRSVIPWSDVLGWRYRALNLIHIRVRQGAGLFLWPLLENYTDLLTEIDTRRREQLRAEMLNK